MHSGPASFRVSALSSARNPYQRTKRERHRGVTRGTVVVFSVEVRDATASLHSHESRP
ncbi:hypothetical protein FB385_0696 [Paramicrobacterium agarici]|nr:hypothetical protein FB385_0696 [Microbacterium agarici]